MYNNIRQVMVSQYYFYKEVSVIKEIGDFSWLLQHQRKRNLALVTDRNQNGYYRAQVTSVNVVITLLPLLPSHLTYVLCQGRTVIHYTRCLCLFVEFLMC